MIHKESPPTKNSFLEDLDNLEVSGNTSAEQLMAYAIFSGRCYQNYGIICGWTTIRKQF